MSLELLERASPLLIVGLAQPFITELSALGLTLLGAPAELWQSQLIDLTQARGEDLPQTLRGALLELVELSSPFGYEVALALACEHRLSISDVTHLSPEDLALTLYLDHRAVFLNALSLIKSEEPRSFVELHPTQPALLHTHICELRRREMETYLRGWFEARNREGYVELMVSEARDTLHLSVHHALASTTVSVVRGATREELSITPTRRDQITFEPHTGRLSITADQLDEVEVYRRLMGRVLFSDSEYFCVAAQVSCEPLIEDLRAALSPEGVRGLKRVELREVALVAIENPYDEIIWRASPLEGAFEWDLGNLLHRDRRLRAIKLALSFEGRALPKLVTLTPPTRLAFDPRTRSQEVRTYLTQRGFLSSAQPSCHMGVRGE